VIIVILVSLGTAALAFQEIKINDFERGEDTILGLKLGLDLQGGSHLVYKAALIDPDSGVEITPTSEQMDALLTTIERRVNGAGLGEPILQLLGEDRLLVQLPGLKDPGRAKRLIGETARLEFKHRILDVERELENLTPDQVLSFQVGTVLIGETNNEFGIPEFRLGTSTEPIILFSDSIEEKGTSTDLTNSTSTSDTIDSKDNTSSDAEEIAAPAIVIEFDETGMDEMKVVVDRLRESLVSRGGLSSVYPNFLTIAVEGQAEQSLLIPLQPIQRLPDGTALVLPTDSLIKRIPNDNKFLINLAFSASTIEDVMGRFTPDAKIVLGELIGAMDEGIGLSGEDLARAYPGQHQSSGLPIVNIEFNSEGTRKFGEITTEIAGTPDLLAIVLDEEELIAPAVNQPITRGVAFIQGRDFTFERVSEISLLLEGGRLPIPITLIQERDIDAILGADSLAKSVVAGVVGLALVLVFMILYYRIPGIVASVALVIYGILLLSVFKILPVTLTLSGVAAVILSIGMAVDANILIFERMKEELRVGRTLLSSINIGFNRAWPAIRDGNASTLITCAILFWFADTLGATIVQGFALTLAIGVSISMFTAIIVSRTLLRIMTVTWFSRFHLMFVPSGKSDLPKQQLENSG
tara:strand:+ start:1597 stop:3513 length:1917 start_codon:yes stop_codon:yes gene_type:complete